MPHREQRITDDELAIMKIVWQRDSATARDVFEALTEDRRTPYTTVLTLMGSLENKGFLEKRPGERAYVYRPAQPREEALRTMVDEFVNRVFDGSARPIVEHLVESRRITPEEISEVAAAAPGASEPTC